MKKTYILPAIDFQQLTSAEQLLTSSVKVGGTVDKANDVGFAKENSHNDDDKFWDQTWGE